MGLVLHLVDGGCMTARGDPGAWRFPAASVVVSGPAQRVGRSLLRQLVSLRASRTQNGLHSTDGIRGCLRCVRFCYAMMVLGGGGGLCDSADRHSPHGQGVVLQSPAWVHGPAACRARRGFHVTGREALVGLETVSVPHLVTEPVKAAFTSLQGRPCAHCLARLPDPSRGVA